MTHTGVSDPLYKLKDAVELLGNWDHRSSDTSAATTLAIEWAEKLLPAIYQTKLPAGMTDDQVNRAAYFAQDAKPAQLLDPLQAAVSSLQKKYGSWQIPWGQINRFQRISPAIDNQFNDSLPSFPVGFASAMWGQLPSYSSRSFAGSRNRYGFNGNSFICAVEFGKRIKARSLLAGGNSGDPASPHFFDQGEMYSKGRFKDVLFYKEDVLKGAERSYRPGE